jgi:hypothetical protein
VYSEIVLLNELNMILTSDTVNVVLQGNSKGGINIITPQGLVNLVPPRKTNWHKTLKKQLARQRRHDTKMETRKLIRQELF